MVTGYLLLFVAHHSFIYIGKTDEPAPDRLTFEQQIIMLSRFETESFEIFADLYNGGLHYDIIEKVSGTVRTFPAHTTRSVTGGRIRI